MTSTTKISENQFANYSAAPDLPKYIIIPSISVNAIVGSVGLTSSNQIGTPDNVYDTDWYNQSAKPGTPGATLIDGHVSSWTTQGVFYNLKNLSAGDIIKLELGNNSILTYQVVKSQIFNSQNVNMASVLTPINPNKSGLNIITCSRDVIFGTNEFNERIVVFAEEV